MPNEQVTVKLNLSTKEAYGEIDNLEKFINNALSKAVDLGVSGNSLKEIEELKKTIAELKKQIDDVDGKKISRSAFYDFRKKTIADIEEINRKVDGLQTSLATTITQLGELGVNVDLNKAITQFDNFAAAINGANEAIELASDRFGKGTDLFIDVDSLDKTGQALSEFEKKYKELDKLLNSPDDRIKPYEDMDMDEAAKSLKEYVEEYKKLADAKKEAQKAYDAAPEDDYVIELANLKKIDMEMSIMATHIMDLKSVLDSIGNDELGSKKALSFLDKYTAIFTHAEGQIQKLEEDSTRLKKQVQEILEVFEDVQIQYTAATNDMFRDKSSEQNLKELKETYSEQVRLADLLKDNVVNLQIIIPQQQLDSLDMKIKNKVEELQAELNKRALEVPVKVVVGGSAYKSDNPLKMSETLVKEARKSQEDIYVDTGKVASKTLSNAIKAAKDYINEAIGEIKEKILTVFKEPIPVQVELDTKSLQTAKNELTEIAEGGKYKVADNLNDANDAAKQLKAALKEILKLETASEQQAATRQKYGGAVAPTQTLQQKVKQYETDVKQILALVQTDVLDKVPGYIRLDIQPSEFEQLKTKIEKGIQPQNLDITSSLSKAQEMAEKIASTLKVLDGFKTDISGTLVSGTDLTLTNQEIGVTIGELRVISDNLLEIKGLLEQLQAEGTIKEVHAGIEQTSIDLSSITQKIDELMLSTRSLIEDLRLDFSLAEVSIKELGEALSKVIIEANTNTLDSKWFNIAKAFREVSDEAGNIDLRKAKNEISSLLSQYQEYVSLGGRYSFDMLTSNTKTLEKLQKVSNQSFNSLPVSNNKSVEDIYSSFEKILVSLNSIDGKLVEVRQNLHNIQLTPEQVSGFEKFETIVSNISKSLEIVNGTGKGKTELSIKKEDAESFEALSKALEEINGLKEVGVVFKTIKISKKNLENISQLSVVLPKVAEGLKQLDSRDSVGFLNQLSELAIASEGLDKLARVLAATEDEIDKAINPTLTVTQSAKEVSKELTDAEKVLDKFTTKFGDNPPRGFEELKTTIEQTVAEMKQIQDIPLSNLTEKDTERYNELNANLEESINNLKQLDQLAKKSATTKMILRINKFLEQSKNLTEEEVAALHDLINRASDISITKAGLEEIGVEFNRIQANAVAAGHTASNFFDAVKNKLKYKWAETFAMFFSFYDIIRYVRELSQTVTELNSNLIELAKVSDASIGQLYRDFNDFYDIAKQTGGTINDIIKSTADWSRNGYNLPESKELARLSSVFQNIGDGLTEAQANEYLVSTLKGFNLEANQAIDIMDKINNVSNNAASSVSNIGEALERSSSAFGAANTDLSQAIALLTTSNEVLQNPETVGTAFKSLSARLRGSTTELEELGEEATVTTSKLRGLVKGLTGVDIQKDEDTFKSIYDILLEIGKEWKNLTDVEQASLSEALFGKRNSQVGFSILNNVKRLEEIYELTQNASGKQYCLYVQKCA